MISLFLIAAVTHAQTPEMVISVFHARDVTGTGRGVGEGECLTENNGTKGTISMSLL